MLHTCYYKYYAFVSTCVLAPAPRNVSPLAVPDETTPLYSHPSGLDSAVYW